MDLEYILYKIIDGYYYITIDDIIYKVVSPTLQIKYRAHRLYNKIIEDNKYDTKSWLSENIVNKILIVYGLWNQEKAKELDMTNKNIDKQKIELYLNFHNSNNRKSLIKNIRDLKKRCEILLSQKSTFDYLTLKNFAENIKQQYILLNTIYDEYDNAIFDSEKSIDKLDIILLEKIINEVYANCVTNDQIKSIARSEYWKGLWNVSKENIFSSGSKYWTDDQRSLISFTKVLESIREHPDAPSEEVIENDDALDGWILYQNHKHTQEKMKKQIDNKYNLTNKNGSEVFLLTADKDEKQTIYSLNDQQTNHNIRQTIALANEKGEVNWLDLPHVKQEIVSMTPKYRK